MSSGNIQVLKICTVRLVEVPIAIVEGIEAAGDQWRKEMFRFLCTWSKVQLVGYAT